MLFRTLKDDLQNFYKDRITFAIGVVLLFSLILFSRLFYLQISKYEDYARLSDSNRIRITRVLSERGFILDRNKKILVKNAPAYELRVVKEDTKDLNLLLNSVKDVVDFDINKARSNIKKSYFYQPTLIARGLTFPQVAYILEHSSDYPGLEIDLQSVRTYTNGEAYSHIIGYMGEVNDEELESSSGKYLLGDYSGKSGIESFYESELKGENGARQVEVDNIGRIYEIIKEKAPIPGNNVVLTIDSELQQEIYKSLKGKRGAVTVLDIRDNSVLAMYSAPSYDLNMFTPFINDKDWSDLLGNKLKPLLNRNIEGLYPPGSVYKPLMALAGLKEGVITADTTFKCLGSYRLNSNFSYNCWRKYGHGDVNLKKALASSCDVYFYNLGRLLEIDNIQYYSNFFSLGVLTGIDLPNEKAAFFPSRNWKTNIRKEAWFPGETVITSIGQGYMTSTPLQIGVMMSALFNGGKVYKPRVVKELVSNVNGEVVKKEAILVREMEIEESFKSDIMEGLVDAVYSKWGTSKRAAVKSMKIGGKTGTAQVVSLKKTENMKDEEIPEHWRDHSWFTGVYPARDPMYVVVVMVEHGGSGGKSAAPVGRLVIEKMLELGYVSKD